MAAVKADNVRASFFFEGDLNWLVLQLHIVMVLQPLTSQLCLDAISLLLAQPMHVVDQLTS